MAKPKFIGPQRPCTIDGCEKAYLARGYCGAHWALWKKYGKPERLPTPPILDECAAMGCQVPPRSTYAQYCENHYYRLRRTGSLDDPRYIKGTTCMAEGCESEALVSVDQSDRSKGGWCRMHFLRLKTRGDLNFEFKGENNNNWTGDEATTGAVHQRIRTMRGKATSWSCTDCARPAAHWSYDRTDPDQKHDPEKGPYSIDIDRYFPRCVSCHKNFDMAFVMEERKMGRRSTGFSAEMRALIIERAEDRCEICGEHFSDMQLHHRRPRGMGGTRRPDTNSPAAGLWLCGEHHRHVESCRSLSYDNGWLVRQSQTPSDIPILRRGVWVTFRDSGAIIPVTTPPVKLEVAK